MNKQHTAAGRCRTIHGNLAHGALNAISVLNLVGFEFPDLIDYGQVMDVQDNLVAI